MAVEKYTDLAPFTFTPDGGSETTGPLQSIQLPFGLQNQVQRHSGRRHGSTIVSFGGSPVVTAVLPIRAALDNFGFGIKKLTDLKLYLSTFDDGARQSGANHSYYHAASGAYVVVDSISVSNQAVAFATIRIIPLSSDGQATPWARVNSAALPSLASEPILNTIGPVSNGGTPEDGLQSVSINMAHALEPVQRDGERYPTSVRYGGSQPVISGQHIGTLGMQTLAGFEGVNVTDLAFFFREYDPANVALKTTGAEINVDDGLLQIDSVSSAQDSMTQTSFSVICESADDNPPLSYSASVTIDT